MKDRRIIVNSNCYHSYSVYDAVDGIAGCGFHAVELTATKGWTEHAAPSMSLHELAAIASYIVLKGSGTVNVQEWVKTVFFVKNKISVYLVIAAGIVLFFGCHMIAAGRVEMILPMYMFFLSLPGNLIIGGLEEAGWMYVLQPRLDKKYGFFSASVLVGVIWIFWHIPLFFIPGTNHCDGVINFWMFNSASSLVGSSTMTWAGTVVANAAMILFSIVIVAVLNRRRYNE